MRKTVPFIALFLVLVASLVSCQTPAGRSAGQVVDDGVITSEVKAKLLNDGFMRGVAIDVDTFEGQVTLTGAVATQQQRDKAGQIASNVRGVKKVNNLLTLKK